MLARLVTTPLARLVRAGVSRFYRSEVLMRFAFERRYAIPGTLMTVIKAQHAYIEAKGGYLSRRSEPG